jgi:alkylhydroperoxidase family enzyme
MSMRRAVARPEGASDLMEDVDRYELSAGLSDAQKAALRMHDAFLTHPRGFGAVRRAEMLEHFSPAQIVELCFKFFWWSTNRASVTLGEDAAHDPDRLTTFHYTELGEYVPHSPRVPIHLQLTDTHTS